MRALLRTVFAPAFFCVAAGNLIADTQELNAVRGLWRMEESLDPYWDCQPSLVADGFTIGGTGDPAPNFEFTFGRPPLPILNLNALTASERLLMPNIAGPNGPAGATQTNEWTIILEIKYSTATNGIALVQDSPTNTDDAEIFINTAGEIEIRSTTGGTVVASDPLATGPRHRIAITSTYNSSTNRQELRVYINGAVTPQTGAGQVRAIPNGKHAFGTNIALFTDNNGETEPLQVTEVGFWGLPLNATDIATLGGFSSAGLVWPNIVAENRCPIPILSGKLRFGSFEATWNPSPNLTGIFPNPAAVPGSVAQIGVVQGAVEGFPDHRFVEFVTGHVMPNGDVVILETVDLDYIGTGADKQVSGDVTFVRSGIELGTFGARAQSIDVYLPAGFGVATGDTDNALDKRVYDRATTSNIFLGNDLVPVTTIALRREHFTGVAGSDPIYPMADRIPVRFATHSVIWYPSAGKFAFAQISGTPLAYHRDPQLLFTAFFAALGQLRDFDLRPASNEIHYFSASEVTASVWIGASADGAASLDDVQFTLDPNKFGATGSGLLLTHYPKMAYSWNLTAGSQMRFADGEVHPDSRMAGAAPAFLTYWQGVPTVGCEGEEDTPDRPAGSVVFTPENDEWQFNRDGGMRAAGVVESVIPNTTTTTPHFLRWGGYKDGPATRFTHSVTPAFDAGRVNVAGVFMPGEAVAEEDEYLKPSQLLLAGHTSPTSSSLVERPGTNGYYDGHADYPGVNLRADYKQFVATSRLADQATPPYDLDPQSKYLLRFGGVSGRHLSDSQDTIDLELFGSDFELTALNLGYIDGDNVSSGVSGAMDIPIPANFSLNFERLLFGGQGQLLSAAIAPGQGDKTMAAWGLLFKPLALDFPQPKVCPQVSPSAGFIQITAESTLTSITGTPLIGTLGFHSGDVVSETKPLVPTGNGSEMVPVAKGLGPISRFATTTNLKVDAPDGKQWDVSPTSGIAVNRWDETSQGILTAAGLMNVPFFEDMPVVISANSANTGPAPEDWPQFVRKPWADLSATFDPDHRGRPSGDTLAEYRSGTTDEHDPVAVRDWQDIITFKYPLRLDTDGVFRSRRVLEKDLFIFKLSQEVTSMTPSALELNFDGSASLTNAIPQVNVGSLLANPILDGLDPGVQPLLDDMLNGIVSLDELMSDHLQVLLKEGLVGAIDPLDLNFSGLAAPGADRKNIIAGYKFPVISNVEILLSGGQRWRVDMLAKIDDAIAGVTSLESIVDAAGNYDKLKKLADAIGGSSVHSNPSAATDPTEGRIAALGALLASVNQRLITVRAALDGGDLYAQLNSSLMAERTAIVDRALEDLTKKWAPMDANVAQALYGSPGNVAFLKADLARMLGDRVAGSQFAGRATQLLRQHLGDPQTLARQAVDDALRMAEQMVLPVGDGNSLPGLGSLKDYVGAAELRGYARINGDALHELRLDGNVNFDLLNDMKFDGWFLVRDVDSDTPRGACLAAGGAKTEVGMGASTEFKWGQAEPVAISVGGKVALDSNGEPVGLTGDFGIQGEFDFSEVKVKELQLGFGFGTAESYLYGRGAGKIQAMDIAAGIFVGRTCDPQVVKNADPDIGAVVDTSSLPITGIAIYAEGGMSLMPIIGIPPSCVLDVRVHGGQGFFGFDNGTAGNQIFGIKMLQGVSGELLCVVNARGDFVTTLSTEGEFLSGSPSFDRVTGTARATMRGEIGVGFFSIPFSKSVKLIIIADGSGTDWDVDY